MQYIYFLLALIAGSMMPAQAAINHKLSTHVQNPVLSSFVSFGVGLVALFLYIIATGIPLGNLAYAKQASPIALMGGLGGAFFVTAVVMVVPHLGVALTFSIIILGQMLATLPIDHFGFLDMPVREVNLTRIFGIVLILLGVFLVRKF